MSKFKRYGYYNPNNIFIESKFLNHSFLKDLSLKESALYFKIGKNKDWQVMIKSFNDFDYFWFNPLMRQNELDYFRITVPTVFESGRLYFNAQRMDLKRYLRNLEFKRSGEQKINAMILEEVKELKIKDNIKDKPSYLLIPENDSDRKKIQDVQRYNNLIPNGAYDLDLYVLSKSLSDQEELMLLEKLNEKLAIVYAGQSRPRFKIIENEFFEENLKGGF